MPWRTARPRPGRGQRGSAGGESGRRGPGLRRGGRSSWRADAGPRSQAEGTGGRLKGGRRRLDSWYRTHSLVKGFKGQYLTFLGCRLLPLVVPRVRLPGPDGIIRVRRRVSPARGTAELALDQKRKELAFDAGHAVCFSEENIRHKFSPILSIQMDPLTLRSAAGSRKPTSRIRIGGRLPGRSALPPWGAPGGPSAGGRESPRPGRPRKRETQAGCRGQGPGQQSRALEKEGEKRIENENVMS